MSNRWRGRRGGPSLAVAAMLFVAACDARPEDREVEMRVRRVAVDQVSQSPVVVLEDVGHTVALPIWIGPGEARAIAMQMEGINPPRPLTHDLMKSVLDRIGVKLRRVVIHELRGTTYYARLFLASGGDEIEVDSRPSDAIALALRFKKPIFVRAAVLYSAGSIESRKTTAETKTLKGVVVQELSRELSEYFGTPAGRGVLVAEVGAGVRSDLRRGDVILEVDGGTVRDLADFRAKLAAAAGPAALSVQRRGRRVRIRFHGDGR